MTWIWPVNSLFLPPPTNPEPKAEPADTDRRKQAGERKKKTKLHVCSRYQGEKSVTKRKTKQKESFYFEIKQSGADRSVHQCQVN